MKSGFSLSIPKPCSEDWNSFTPTHTGGFCSSCNKNVIDFTKATDDDIIAFISKMPEHACGRFNSYQLKAYTLLPPDKIRPGFMLLKAGVISLLLLLISKPSHAQISVANPTYQTTSQPILNPALTQGTNLIKGSVRDEYKDLLPGISVVQKGTSNGTQTNAVGEYEITLQQSFPQVLVFSFVGMKVQEISITDASDRAQNIIMFYDPSQWVGELVITGEVAGDTPYKERTSGLKRFFRKIKSWF